MILLPPLIASLVTIGLAYVALIISRHYGGSRAVWIVGGLILVGLGYELVKAKLFCDAPPKFIPPSCSDADSCGDGRMIFNCDAPFGGGDRLLIYLFGPFSAIVVLILTYVVAKQKRKKGSVT